MKKRILMTVMLASIAFVQSSFAANSNCPQNCTNKCLSNKTFLMPRDIGTNSAMDFTILHTIRHPEYLEKNHFGARLSATGFYKESTNESDLGYYFGWLNDTPNTVNDFIAVTANDPNSVFPLAPQNIIHDALNFALSDDETVNPLRGLLRFRPRQDVYGVKFAYEQKLDKWVDGLSLKVSAPLTHVQNTIVSCRNNCKAETTNKGNSKPCKSGCATSCTRQCFTLNNRTQRLENTTGNGGTGKEVTLLDYLRGAVSQNQDPNKQFPLCSAKIACESDSETVFGDVRAELAYNILHDEDYHWSLAAVAVFPTSNTPSGEFLFEAVGGNGNAWGLGFTTDGHATWDFSKRNSLEFHGSFHYQYVFEKTQMRTIGFKRRDGNFQDFGHYLLGGKKGQKELFPLANVLTRRVDVEAGSKIDALAALSFVCTRGFTLDIGYNVFYKDSEDVKVCSWQDDTYAIANFSYNSAMSQGSNSAGGFDPSSADAFNSGVSGTDSRAIQSKDLCPDAASTPSQLTHTLFGGIGYTNHKCSIPWTVGLGASYEWADRRTALEGWAIWGSLGFAL